MNTEGFAILLIPLMGLAAIFPDGHFRWRVMPSSQFLNVVFWFGWFCALCFGLLMLTGILK